MSVFLSMHWTSHSMPSETPSPVKPEIKNNKVGCVQKSIDFPVYATESMLTLGNKLALVVLASNEQ